ncbi:hypothetical protein Atc_2020 [Acidithiobacillus caldus SM-1]|uniref:Uncharacterized protein n=1 Tax=Acidithiobacillus caldus (strain SM-1) TaxID=990288 RepID=F9ZQH9_ACICS|nr:hypothetical protein [Acidithiobacillus caldus]AEK58668.1 hypothetical protein Atc_2020 [Acidithiobacillus caldus SM-1]
MQTDWKTFESALKKDLQHLRSGEKESLRFLTAVHPVLWYWLIAAEHHLQDLPCLDPAGCHPTEMHFLLERLAQCDQTMTEADLLDFVDNQIHYSLHRLATHRVRCFWDTHEEVWPWPYMPYPHWRTRYGVTRPDIQPVPMQPEDARHTQNLLHHLKTWYLRLEP